MKKLLSLLMLLLAFSCKDKGEDIKPPVVEPLPKAKSVKVQDLGNHIKKFDVVDLPTSRTIGKKHYYSKFNLAKGAYVVGDDWDIAFYNRSIIVNGGVATVGQGTYMTELLERKANAALAILGKASAEEEAKEENLVITAKETDGDYLSVKEVPKDIKWLQDKGDAFAIDDDSKAMFEYNNSPFEHIVTVKKNRFLIIRTHNGHYAKLKILSYYQGAGATAKESLSSGSMESGLKYANFYTFTYNYNTKQGDKELQ